MANRASRRLPALLTVWAPALIGGLLTIVAVILATLLLSGPHVDCGEPAWHNVPVPAEEEWP